MFASIPRRHAHLSTAARRAAARLRRPAAALAAITCSVLVSAGLIPAAWASTNMIPLPPGGGTGPAVPVPAVRVITTGGMAGWQITLIAVGAALAAAAMAILLDRARAARRAARATTACSRPRPALNAGAAPGPEGPGAARPGENMVTNPNPAEDAGRARDDQPVTDLVNRARNCDKQAWDMLVDRYAPLIWSVCRRYRLDDTDANDVGQSVWLSLAIHLGKLADPVALPGWLVTTTRRECGRVLRAAARASSIAGQVPNIEATPDQHAVTGVPRSFRTVHPIGWTIWKGEVIAPTEEELLTGIQG